MWAGRVARVLGVSLYVAVTRLLLAAALLFTNLFFVLNASPLPPRITDLVQKAIPGRIEFSSLQLSPIPWQLDFQDVAIKTWQGETIIAAGNLNVTVELRPLVKFLMGEADNLILVNFKSIRLRDFRADIVFDELGHLSLLDAFVFPPQPEPEAPAKGPPGPRVRLKFGTVLGENGACLVKFPEWDILVEGVRLTSNLIVSIEDTTYVRVDGPDVTWTHGIGHIRVVPGLAVIPREVPVGEGHVEGFVYDWDKISFHRARIAFGGMALDAQGARLSWVGGLPYEGTATLWFPEDSPLLDTATAGLAHGPVLLKVAGKGDVHDARFRLDLSSPGLTFRGVDLGETAFGVRGGRDGTGAYAFQDVTLSSRSATGTVKVRDGILHPFGSGPDLVLDGGLKVEAEDLELPALLRSLGVEPPGPPVPLPRMVTGKVDGEVVLRKQGQPRLEIDVRANATGDLPRGTVLGGRDVQVKGRARLEAGGDDARIVVPELLVRSGADQASARGTLDLGRETLDARGAVQLDLAPLLGSLGVRAKGHLGLSDVRVTGPLTRLVAKARTDLAEVAVGDWAVSNASGDVAWAEGTLTATGVEATTPWAQVAAPRLAVRLTAPDFGPAPVRLAVEGPRLTALDLARLPPLSTMGLRGRGEAKAARVEYVPSEGWRSLTATEGAVSFPGVQAAGRSFALVEAAASVRDGRVEIPRASANLRGGGRIEASGEVDVPGRKFRAALSLRQASLPTLAGMAKTGSLQGTVDLEAKGSGALSDPVLEVSATLSDLAFRDLKPEPVSLRLDRAAGGDAMLSSTRFLPHMRVRPTSAITWADGAFRGVRLGIDLDELTLQDLMPSIRPRDVWAELTGALEVRMGFGPGGVLEASLESPSDGLRLGFFNREVLLRNASRLRIDVLKDGAVTVSGVALDDGTGILEACGTALDPDGRSQLLIRGPVGLYWLRAFKSAVSLADGYVFLSGLPGSPEPGVPPGCPASMGQNAGALEVTGTLSKPMPRGLVTTGPLGIGFRRYADEVRVQPGGRIVLEPRDGKATARIPEDAWIRGTVGDGRFALYGRTTLEGITPDVGEVSLTGTGLRFVVPGEYYVVGNPDVTLSFDNLSVADGAKVQVAGGVRVTEGAYHKNFDVVRRAFSGVTGPKVAQRESRSLADVAPWLAAADLDLRVTGQPFGVRSKIAIGSTDLEVGFDLQIKGTVGAPELWNRLEVLSGGKFVYEVVRREFEVTRGTLDFTGDPARPLVDVTARTYVQYAGAASSSANSASRFAPDALDQGRLEEDQILVTMKVTGRYPDVDVALSSTSRALTQTDLQYLLLTGATPRDSSGLGTNLNVGLLTEDVADLMAKLLLSQFVDAVSFGVSPSGNVNVDVSAHMGSRLRFDTQVLQDATGGSRYTAGFHVRLTDRLFLEGRVRAVEGGALTAPAEPDRRYETKLRYRIPLD